MVQETKRRIRSAALELFTELGYVSTTIDAIAERAGVSRRTVFNTFASKGRLLVDIFLAKVRGDDTPEPRWIQRRIQEVRQLDDPRAMIGAFADASAEMATRTRVAWTLAQEAARVDTEVAALLRSQEEERFRSSVLVDLLAKRGMLRTDLPREFLRRGIWMLAGPATAFTAIEAGMTPDLYRTWLAACLDGLLLPPTTRRAMASTRRSGGTTST